MVKKDLEERPTPYPHIAGRGSSILKDYKPPMLPYLYFIDKNGKINYGELFLKFETIKEIIDDLIDSSVLYNEKIY